MRTVNQTLATLQAAASKRNADRRRMLRIGATFASFTIRQKTPVAERHFAQWVAAGMPNDVRKAGIHGLADAKNARLADIARLTDSDIAEIFTLPEHLASQYFADRVQGYGPAKAGFSLACAGAPGATACFDSHLCEQYATELAAAGFKPTRGSKKPKGAGLVANVWNAYADLCYRVYGPDSAHGQWSEWLDRYSLGCTHSILLEVQGC
jgi:hypothetical protein